MGTELLFTACLLGAAALGGFVGACCSKGRQAGDHARRIAELEDRLDALADTALDEIGGLKSRTADLENQFEESRVWMGDIDARVEDLGHLVGDLPTDGLLGRVGALEDAARKEAQDGR